MASAEEIKRLIELDFPILARDRDQEGARNLKRDIFPQALYKYCAFDKEGYSVENIQKQQVFLKLASEFNDPFEGLPFANECYFPAKTIYDIKNLYKKSRVSQSDVSDDQVSISELNNYIESLGCGFKTIDDLTNDLKIRPQSFLYEFSRRLLVSCFSEINNSVLMWSHYAFEHKGFCVKYVFDERALTDFFDEIYPVLYEKERFAITGSFFKYTQEKVISSAYLGHVALIKSPEWSYEREWRLIQPNGSGSQVRQFIRPAAIYLGCRADLNDLQVKRLLKVCKQKEIEIYRMQIHESKFELVPNKIDLNDYL